MISPASVKITPIVKSTAVGVKVPGRIVPDAVDGCDVRGGTVGFTVGRADGDAVNAGFVPDAVTTNVRSVVC